jgi:hypothetical protein
MFAVSSHTPQHRCANQALATRFFYQGEMHGFTSPLIGLTHIQRFSNE